MRSMERLVLVLLLVAGLVAAGWAAFVFVAGAMEAGPGGGERRAPVPPAQMLAAVSFVVWPAAAYGAWRVEAAWGMWAALGIHVGAGLLFALSVGAVPLILGTPFFLAACVAATLADRLERTPAMA